MTESTLDASRLEDFRWLVGPEAAELLAQLGASGHALLSQAAALRQRLSPARVHLALEQTALRRRAKSKFTLADQMFFTPIGLEQATDQWVAGYKASRFPAGVRLADLCCGVGGDLLALADRAAAEGVDRDPAMAIVAQANLAISPGARRGSSVLCSDVAQVDLRDCESWHADPDRRPAGQRTTRVDDHEPGTGQLERLLAACPSGAIKLAPAAQLPEGWSVRAELEWIGRGGECRQLVAWFGALTTIAGQRRATIVRPDGEPRTLTGEGLAWPAPKPTGVYLYEPDSAVLAAGLVGELAGQHDLAPLGPGVAYLTGERAIHDPALAGFAVEAVLPMDARRVKALLRARRIGRLEVKKRGVPHDPDQVRRQLRVPGDERGTLLLAPVGGGVMAILAHRLAPADSGS